MLNIVLLVFNLLPIPPLDGYRVVEDLAPTNIRAKMTQYEKYGAIALLILVITPLSNYTIQPILMLSFHTYLHFKQYYCAYLLFYNH